MPLFWKNGVNILRANWLSGRMTKRLFFVLTVLLYLGIQSCARTELTANRPRIKDEGSVFRYVIDDFTVYAVPDTPRPPKGVTFQDPVFHTNITRITDAISDSRGSRYSYAQPGYPKHNIESADGSKLVIQSLCYPSWHIWNANPPYNKIRDIPNSIVGDKDPDVRWDNSDPQILYSTHTSKFYKFNVETGQILLLHDFKNDFPNDPVVRAFTGEEGDASDDRRYWAFIILCNDTRKAPPNNWYVPGIVVYNKDFYSRDKGRVVAKLARTDPKWKGANFVSMSPSGKYVHVGAPPSWIYPRDFSSIREIGTHGHVDLAYDDEGKEVMVWVGRYFGPTGNVDHGYWVAMADVETGAINWLAPFGSVERGFHVSGNSHDKPGWAVVSSYYPNCGEVPSQWSDVSILMYELTRRISHPTWGNHARVWRIAHTRMCRKDYGDDPFAKINKKGTKVWFGSGWGQSYTDAGAQYDVYQIDLPRTWYQDLVLNKEPVAHLKK